MTHGLLVHNPYVYKGYYYDSDTGYYYLKSRYYDPRIHRFLSADKIDYLDPKSLSSLNLYVYCGDNPVMYCDPSGKFPLLITLAIIFGIGALSGAVGTFIGDVANFALTGNWKWSSWETYVGAAVGYGIGAILTAVGLSTLGLAIGSGLSTFVGMSLEKVSGSNNQSWLEIMGWSVVSFTTGAIMGHFTKGLRVSGLTSGRGSFQHVMRTQFTNMLKHGYNISFKSAAKSFIALTVSRQIVGNIGKGLFEGIGEWFDYIVNGDSSGLGWI